MSIVAGRLDGQRANVSRVPLRSREHQQARDIAIVQLREGLHPIYSGRHSWRQIAAKVGISFKAARFRYLFLTIRPQNAKVVWAIRDGRLG